MTAHDEIHGDPIGDHHDDNWYIQQLEYDMDRTWDDVKNDAGNYLYLDCGSNARPEGPAIGGSGLEKFYENITDMSKRLSLGYYNSCVHLPVRLEFERTIPKISVGEYNTASLRRDYDKACPQDADKSINPHVDIVENGDHYDMGHFMGSEKNHYNHIRTVGFTASLMGSQTAKEYFTALRHLLKHRKDTKLS